MDVFLSPEQLKDFHLFTLGHICMITLFLFILLTIIVFREKIRDSKRLKNTFRWAALITLVVSEVSYQTWCIIEGVWDPAFQLPLQLCSISSLLVIYFLLKPSEKRFQLVYFVALIPPFLAILTPDLLYVFPHYRFVQFFIHHITLTSTVLYYLIVEGYRPQFKSIWKAVLFVNLLAIPIGFLNRYLGANYMFLEGAPDNDTLLSWFGEGMRYMINLEIVMVLTFVLTYLPFIYPRPKQTPELDV